MVVKTLRTAKDLLFPLTLATAMRIQGRDCMQRTDKSNLLALNYPLLDKPPGEAQALTRLRLVFKLCRREEGKIMLFNVR